MRHLAILTLLLCLPAGAFAEESASLPAPSTETKSLPKGEPYLDQETGALFPAKAGAFIKTEVVKSPNPFYGTVVRYASPDGSCADIYIYSVGQGALDSGVVDAHFAGVKQSIERLPSAGGVVDEVVSKGESNIALDGDGGSINAKRASFIVSAGEGDFNSELLIFPFKGKIVKLRMSSPLSPDGGPCCAGFLDEMGRVFKKALPSDGGR